MTRQKALSWLMIFLIVLVSAGLVGVEVLTVGLIAHAKQNAVMAQGPGNH